MKFPVLPLTFLFLVYFSYESKAESNLEKARRHFESGRYWDAFTLCRSMPERDSDIAILSLSENSKKAVIFQQKYRIHRELQQYSEAIEKLESLIAINPKDPDKGDIAVMAYLQAKKSHQYALVQQYRSEAEFKLREAVRFYQKSLQEGFSAQEIIPKLKLCERQLNIVSIVNDSTTTITTRYEVSESVQQKTLGSERNDPEGVQGVRKVIIMKNDEE
jgi:tetratricopeptide (TPR) repeat protein